MIDHICSGGSLRHELCKAVNREIEEQRTKDRILLSTRYEDTVGPANDKE